MELGMTTENTLSHPSKIKASAFGRFPPLAQVGLTHVSTEQAAFYLNRRPQTLREWAMTGKVIAPLRVNGRLAWPIDAIKRVLEVM